MSFFQYLSKELPDADRITVSPSSRYNPTLVKSMFIWISVSMYSPTGLQIVGMNIHFDNPLQSQTKQTLTTLGLDNPVQVINEPTHTCGHIIDRVIVRPDDDIHKKIYCFRLISIRPLLH